ncbi:MAG: PLD nuclease N-terminal domain-containing protein [Microbacteriaceae bacterium]
MGRLVLFGVFVAIALSIYAIVDVILIDRGRIKSLNKVSWAVIAVLPVIGPLLWFVLGKKARDAVVQYRSMAPDDDPSFLGRIARDEEQDERIRRLEQELAELDSNDLDGTDRGTPGAGYPDDDQPRR